MDDVEAVAQCCDVGEARTPFFDGSDEFKVDILAGNKEDEEEGPESPFEIAMSILGIATRAESQSGKLSSERLEKRMQPNQ